jgi:hypothetical protein
MSEEMYTDPLGLGIDLSGVDTSRPCLPEQLHVLNIDKVEIKPNKKETGRNLVVVFKTVNDSPDVTGARIISAGYPITKYYPLQQSDNEKAPDYKADLARLQDAVEGTKQGERPPFQPYNYVNKLVMARIRVKKDEEYGDSNEISKLEPVTA